MVAVRSAYNFVYDTDWGMGIVTMAIVVTMLSGKKINLTQRSAMQESISANKVGGIIRLSRFIIITSAVIELLGAIVLAFVFCNPKTDF